MYCYISYHHTSFYFPDGCTSLKEFYIPINTPRNISCSLQGRVISGALLKFRNSTLIDKDVLAEPVELIPGIVATRDSFLSTVITINTTNTEVVGLGCSGTKSMIIFNVTVFGELQFVNTIIHSHHVTFMYLLSY